MPSIPLNVALEAVQNQNDKSSKNKSKSKDVVVDVFFLDTEGSEAAILGGVDFARVEIGLLVVETQSQAALDRVDGVLLSQRLTNRNKQADGEGEGAPMFVRCDKACADAHDTIYFSPSYFAKRGLTPPQ